MIFEKKEATARAKNTRRQDPAAFLLKKVEWLKPGYEVELSADQWLRVTSSGFF